MFGGRKRTCRRGGKTHRKAHRGGRKSRKTRRGGDLVCNSHGYCGLT